MVNIRTFVLNDRDFRTISNFRTISGQLCNFRNFRTAGTPGRSSYNVRCNLYDERSWTKTCSEGSSKSEHLNNGHSVQQDHPSVQWSKLIISQNCPIARSMQSTCVPLFMRHSVHYSTAYNLRLAACALSHIKDILMVVTQSRKLRKKLAQVSCIKFSCKFGWRHIK